MAKTITFTVPDDIYAKSIAAFGRHLGPTASDEQRSQAMVADLLAYVQNRITADMVQVATEAARVQAQAEAAANVNVAQSVQVAVS